MKRVTLALTIVLGLASVAHAQSMPTAVAGDSVGWNQGGPNLTAVTAYIYHLYDSGVLVTPSLSGVACTNAAVGDPTPFVCQAPLPIPPMVAGVHTITLTASDNTGESLPSAPLTFQIVVSPLPPSSPINVRLIKHA